MARTMSDEQEREARSRQRSTPWTRTLLSELDAERAAHEVTKDKLGAAHREANITNEELCRDIAALKARLALAEKWAAFGSDCFDGFWYDGEPSDLDAGDMQELALSHGLLRHRTEGDNTLDPDADSCCEHCPCVTEDAPPSECECLFPTLAPWRAAK